MNVVPLDLEFWTLGITAKLEILCQMSIFVTGMVEVVVTDYIYIYIII